jgi:hypothetical protein
MVILPIFSPFWIVVPRKILYICKLFIAVLMFEILSPKNGDFDSNSFRNNDFVFRYIKFLWRKFRYKIVDFQNNSRSCCSSLPEALSCRRRGSPTSSRGSRDRFYKTLFWQEILIFVPKSSRQFCNRSFFRFFWVPKGRENQIYKLKLDLYQYL